MSFSAGDLGLDELAPGSALYFTVMNRSCNMLTIETALSWTAASASASLDDAPPGAAPAPATTSGCGTTSTAPLGSMLGLLALIAGLGLRRRPA